MINILIDDSDIYDDFKREFQSYYSSIRIRLYKKRYKDRPEFEFRKPISIN